MEPLRVAHVVTSLVAGGAQRQEVALAEGLPRERFQVDFLTLGGPGEYDQRARDAGARVIHLAVRPRPGDTTLARQRRRVALLRRYVRAVRMGGYDIVDAWLYPDDVLVALLRGLTATPVVMSGRRNVHAHDRFGPLRGTIDRLVDRRTEMVVANSAAAARNAVRAHHTDPSRLRVIHNGVELMPPLSEADRRRWRRHLGVEEGELLVGCVGRLQTVKGHARLIDAFARLAAGRPVALVLVGEGSLRESLERQIRERGLTGRVRLHGAEHDPRPLYGAFDIVAQASLSEGLPNVLLEAAAAGVPVIATDVGGTSEVVIDGQTGLLVPDGDEDALVGALQRAIGNADLRQRMGVAARAHVARSFSMTRFVGAYADLYEELAAASRHRHESRPG